MSEKTFNAPDYGQITQSVLAAYIQSGTRFSDAPIDVKNVHVTTIQVHLTSSPT